MVASGVAGHRAPAARHSVKVPTRAGVRYRTGRPARLPPSIHAGGPDTAGRALPGRGEGRAAATGAAAQGQRSHWPRKAPAASSAATSIRQPQPRQHPTRASSGSVIGSAAGQAARRTAGSGRAGSSRRRYTAALRAGRTAFPSRRTGRRWSFGAGGAATASAAVSAWLRRRGEDDGSDSTGHWSASRTGAQAAGGRWRRGVARGGEPQEAPPASSSMPVEPPLLVAPRSMIPCSRPARRRGYRAPGR